VPAAIIFEGFNPRYGVIVAREAQRLESIDDGHNRVRLRADSTWQIAERGLGGSKPTMGTLW
jgi:hypothetical protein